MAMSVAHPNGVTAELVHVPARYARNADEMFTKGFVSEVDVDLRGKIVVSEGFGMPGKVAWFEQRGAIGMIAVNPGHNPHWGICTTVWGTPDLRDLPRKPKIAVVAVNNPDGLALIEVAKAGGSVTLTSEVTEGWWESPIPVVTIPGTEEPDAFVLLHGHYDSWDFGIGDNAVGDGTLLEVARVLWEHRADLKRSVRIAWWPGHSTGRYAGSTWFADAFALDLYEHCIAQVNCDSPGCRWATEYKDISWMDETEAYCQSVIRDVTGQESRGERPHQAGDYSFNNIGISSFFMLLSTMKDSHREELGYYAVGGCGANIAWHTEEDLIHIADREILEKDIKIYLAAVMGVANATVAPFNFRQTLRTFGRTLDQYQEAVGRGIRFCSRARGDRGARQRARDNGGACGEGRVARRQRPLGPAPQPGDPPAGATARAGELHARSGLLSRSRRDDAVTPRPLRRALGANDGRGRARISPDAPHARTEPAGRRVARCAPRRDRGDGVTLRRRWPAAGAARWRNVVAAAGLLLSIACGGGEPRGAPGAPAAAAGRSAFRSSTTRSSTRSSPRTSGRSFPTSCSFPGWCVRTSSCNRFPISPSRGSSATTGCTRRSSCARASNGTTARRSAPRT